MECRVLERALDWNEEICMLVPAVLLYKCLLDEWISFFGPQFPNYKV